MKYQLVLQFPEKLIRVEDLTTIEDDLIGILKNDEVDGHDAGSGEVNFFILTNSPENTFNNLKQYLVDKALLSCTKSAYRRLNEEEYVILYPSSLKEFNIR